MKAEINWTPGPPTKIGMCLVAIKGSEHAIPACLGESGNVFSMTNPAVKYDPDTIAYHAAWPVFPRERDERWLEYDRRTYEDEPTAFTMHRFGDSSPILDGSEMIGDETADEYLDRLVKEATPSWQGVDPQRFLNEVRGRNAGLEWKKGAPDISGAYLIITRIMKASELYDEYNPDDEYWGVDEVLWHIGPIPPVPQTGEE